MTKDKLKTEINPEECPGEDEQPAEAGEGTMVEISKEEFEKVITSIGQLVKEKEDIEQKLARMTADFDNFRRRTRIEKDDIVKSANHQLAEGLLPVLDNFERALDAGEESPFLEGVLMIYRQFEMVLTQAGLESIEALNQDFDPQFHEAVLQEEAEADQKSKVLEEIQKGYLFRGKLLRPSMVKVGV